MLTKDWMYILNIESNLIARNFTTVGDRLKIVEG